MLQPNTFSASPMILRSMKSEGKESTDKLKEIQDLFLKRYQNEPINDVLNSLKSLAFSIRLEFAMEVVESTSTFTNYLNILDSSIATSNQKSFISSFAKFLASVMNDYRDLISVISEKTNPMVFDEAGRAKVNKNEIVSLSYEQFSVAMNSLLGFEHFMDYIDASLIFDLAIWIADEVINGEIELSSNRVRNELMPVIEKSLVDYGKYATLLGFFEPIEDAHDYGRFFKMKMLARSIRTKRNKSNQVKFENVEDLEKILSA